jgi:hypothetical protein
MTLQGFLEMPPTLAARLGSRCLLCGEQICLGEEIKDAAIYEKVHSHCLAFAKPRLAGDHEVTFRLRQQFLATRAAEAAQAQRKPS